MSNCVFRPHGSRVAIDQLYGYYTPLILGNRYINTSFWFSKFLSVLEKLFNVIAGHVTRIISLCMYKTSFKSKFLHSSSKENVKGRFDAVHAKLHVMLHGWHEINHLDLLQVSLFVVRVGQPKAENEI